ncbi:hypothetical protein FGG08_006236 [Glutinoglossum americanum]|uniref:2-oxoisovalerate dehydrogenase subunit alpha n=1 Tax=Glutinoglossum americanum TaxID=1670608 RepID=A0A9P8HYR6_9PEZI|nr:hypothetical protein FGG08_006236 [Glutinoglossum americanum]
MDSDGVIVDEERAPKDVKDEEAVKLYKDMLLSEFGESRVAAGEEGTIIGSASALTPDDVIFAQYREAGVLRQRGFGLDEFMANFFSNGKDLSKGRNMPNHFASRRLNVLPHAAGAAYALKMRRLADPNQPPAVAVCYFGEGAASEGDFHAALNIAATRSCPVVYICRNNGYAISTPTLEQYRGDGIASRGVGYGIETIRVDGNDIWAVREATREARRLALSGGGKPVLIEAMSYRVSHHSTSDDSFAYRARVEVEDWKRRDNPITRMRKYLERKGIWDDAREQESREGIKKEVMKAFMEGEREKKHPIGELFTDIYETETEEARGQREELGRILREYEGEYDVEEFERGREGV